jgi:hypothetical protein
MMDMRKIVSSVTVLCGLMVVFGFGLSGCGSGSCEEEEFKSLLLPAVEENDTEEALTESPVPFATIDSGITCLNELAFSRIPKQWTPEAVESDYAVTEAGYSVDSHGDYFAGALVIRNLEAYNGLIASGCLAQPTVPLTVDWTTQTMVVVSLKSRNGCPVSASAEIQNQTDGVARLTAFVEYIPKAGCMFEYGQTFIIDQVGAKARFSVNSTCSE